MDNCRIYVIDLGFALDMSKQPLCKEGCGTVGYMAPENFKKEKDSKSQPIQLTFKADLYSIGVIFYEMYHSLTQGLRHQSF